MDEIQVDSLIKVRQQQPQIWSFTFFKRAFNRRAGPEKNTQIPSYSAFVLVLIKIIVKAVSDSKLKCFNVLKTPNKSDMHVGLVKGKEEKLAS